MTAVQILALACGVGGGSGLITGWVQTSRRIARIERRRAERLPLECGELIRIKRVVDWEKFDWKE